MNDDPNSFVIQQHAARRMHWDVRFRVGDVMPSWSVPKGPSCDPKQRRLAVLTEDHPLDYQDFEGVIPKGEYGAGRVIVWDNGTYENVTRHDGELVAMQSAIERGHFAVVIHGRKLQGEWTFSRMNSAKEPNAWMMIKKRDDTANANRDIVEEAPQSVISGHTIDTIGSSEARWTRGMATWTPPMHATASAGLPDGEWIFEPAFEGVRCIAVRNGSDVELSSDHHVSVNEQYPDTVSGIAAFAVDNVVLDGVIDKSGYHVFDLLHLLTQSTVDLPLEQRKALLSKLLTDGPPNIQYVETISRAPGTIAKRAQSPYRSGPSSDWLHING